MSPTLHRVNPDVRGSQELRTSSSPTDRQDERTQKPIHRACLFDEYYITDATGVLSEYLSLLLYSIHSSSFFFHYPSACVRVFLRANAGRLVGENKKADWTMAVDHRRCS